MIFRELSNAGFPFCSTMRRSRDRRGGVQTPPPPPSRSWKIQRPSRARVKLDCQGASRGFIALSLDCPLFSHSPCHFWRAYVEQMEKESLAGRGRKRVHCAPAARLAASSARSFPATPTLNMTRDPTELDCLSRPVKRSKKEPNIL